MESFDVYVAGFEVNEERATRGLMRVFGMSEAAARIFVRSVPRIGKRHISRDAADRYMQALSSVGARTECRPSAPASVRPMSSSAPPSEISSLPPPSLEIEADDIYAWRDEDFGGATIHRTPTPSPLPIRDDGHYLIRPEHVGMSLRPARAGSSASDIPAAPSTPAAPIPAPPRAWYRRPTLLLILAFTAASGLAYGVHRDLFHSARGLREQAWREAGIEPGRYLDATLFLDDASSHFNGLDTNSALSLTEGLRRAGAIGVWVIGIVMVAGSPTAHAFLVELPGDPAQRRTIFFQHLSRVSRRRYEDSGQRFLEVDF